mgnify:CR=1 FL=1
MILGPVGQDAVQIVLLDDAARDHDPFPAGIFAFRQHAYQRCKQRNVLVDGLFILVKLCQILAPGA